jgi:CubicO group peptidase (beta-lactamase class C family)
MNSSTCSKKKKRIFYSILAVIIVILLAAAIYLNTLMPIITGYAAKNLCSAVFVSERNQENVEDLDLNFSFISFVKNRVDNENKTVTSRFLWGKSTAVYREGFGVTLLQEKDVEELKAITFPEISATYSGDTIKWPMGDIIPDSITGIDRDALNSISDKLINDNAYGGTAFAFVVLHKGIPVAEAYKPLLNKDTRFLSWSMAKSVINALVGIMVKDSVLYLEEKELIPEWSGDGRNDITLNNLMQMQSGLEWNEDYGNRSDITVMLHCVPDFAEYAYTKPLEYEPGTHWNYSGGTTNIVSYILRNQFDTDDAYYAFPHEKLFYRIGITDAIFEPDESGTLVGSSYLYMKARDYARFALLYIQDGIFDGNRILPEGWVDYVTTTASNSNGGYGSFFWLNHDGGIKSAPEEMYMCVGHDGQRIYIIPSLDLITVVLGYSPDDSMDFNQLLADIIGTL